MKKLVDFGTQEDFLLFAKIIKKVAEGNIVATIKQVSKNGDDYTFFDVQQTVAQTKVSVQINGDYVYFTANNLMRTDVRKLKTLWNTVLQKGTQCFEKGEENKYLFQIDVLKNELEKGFVYSITGVQPIFVSGDGDKDLTFVFNINDVRCSEDEITMYDVEYEQSMRDASEDEVHRFEDTEEDDNVEETEEDELLSNDKYLNTDEFNGLG